MEFLTLRRRGERFDGIHGQRYFSVSLLPRSKNGTPPFRVGC